MATGNVYTYRMPAGIPGAVSRELAAVEEPHVLSTANTPAAYGDPVKIGTDGRIQAFGAGDAITALYGFLVRPYPTQNAVYNAQGFGPASPMGGRPCTVLKSGYISVVIQGTTVAANGGAVYIRVAGTVPTPGKIGGLEAAADPTAGNTLAVPVPNSYFRGAADAQGNSELAYNL